MAEKLDPKESVDLRDLLEEIKRVAAKLPRAETQKQDRPKSLCTITE